MTENKQTGIKHLQTDFKAIIREIFFASGLNSKQKVNSALPQKLSTSYLTAGVASIALG